ncbi:hypothetical protein LTR91_018554 [Friedmanniomyces endolithicus]|uniref:Uncharacterized protein n=1 Tax=Friedmanniomyces endolithicus TaxID=329885 RepID=A0AAN6K2W7_9PEZI|nr:hypothetical protein LTR35_014301 [Friedmanniomyces endolithicus]KAK0272596.1 hypothetical protein LTS00_016188 [Friedmanniomyces endolithicus]KAK0306133.1 hypothetical protein LTR01_006481 [Friedmanniomyces endolithicus]KAK0308157.1 hypothetical protein LTR82_015731 [Friedmanniomyces endolithicus]KAK0828156.1 hypothetical protein LTR73_005109 [Friedmanniomyces endolithicus]
MNWRSLATTQKQQLAESTTTIDSLNQRLSTFSQQVVDLQFQLAVQGETTLRRNSDSDANERLSKVRLEYDILKAEHDQLLTRAEAAEAGIETAARICTQKDTELRQLFSTSQAQLSATNALEQALAQADFETNEARTAADRLREQLAVARRDLASRQWRERCPDGDQDDEEVAPPGRKLGQKRKRVQFAPSPPAGEPQQLPTSLSPTTTHPSAPTAAAAKPILRRPTDRSHAAGATASTPRPISKARPARNRSLESRNDIGEEELQGLSIQDSQSSTGKRSRSHKSLAEEGYDEDDGPPPFEFNAVTSWNADGSVGGGYPNEDLYKGVGELWEKIELVRDFWEQRAGKYWQDDFTKKGRKACLPQWVTKKLCGGKDMEFPGSARLAGGQTLWRADSKGKAACQDCVANGWPCFTWFDGNGGELLLLPLHEHDRRLRVEVEFEIRYWVNA